MDYAKNLHPSSIPRNPLCLSGAQGLNGTNLPFITLHRLSFPVIFCHSNCFLFVMNSLPELSYLLNFYYEFVLPIVDKSMF